MNFHNKLFRRYSVLLLGLLFVGCASSSFFYPWQQIEYSNDNQVKIFKTEMNKDDAISILKTYIRDYDLKIVQNETNKDELILIFEDQVKIVQNETNKIYIVTSPSYISDTSNKDILQRICYRTNKSYIVTSPSYISDTSNKDILQLSFDNAELREKWAQRIHFSRLKNIVIDKERIAYDYSIECWAFLRGSENYNIYKYDGDDSIVSSRLEYSDVKKIKLFECTEVIGIFYEIGLFNEANKLIFYFTPPRRGNQMEQAQRLIAALSILMPHAKEEYNDKRFMVPPQYGGQPGSGLTPLFTVIP